jgi:hypothetical protein
VISSTNCGRIPRPAWSCMCCFSSA